MKKIGFQISFLIISIFTCLACEQKQQCWEIDKIQDLLSNTYSTNCDIYSKNDTLIYIVYTNKVGNSGEVDIIKEEILYNSYILNSDNTLCQEGFFLAIISKDSLQWAIDASKKDLYTIIFRNMYYPELHKMNLYILDSIDSKTLNTYDTVVNTITENKNWSEIKPRPQSFSRLSALYAMERLKGINDGVYEQVLRTLLERQIPRKSINKILAMGNLIKGRFPEGEGIPWPVWNEEDDYVRQIQEFKRKLKEQVK